MPRFRTPASTSSLASRVRSTPGVFPRPLAILITVGSISILVTGILAVFADWLTASRLVRPWLQCTATFLGCLLILAASLLRPQSWLRRLLLLCGGLLLVLAVLDSLDGQQDWLPMVVVLLSVWALEYAYTCLYLLDTHRVRSRRRWLAIGLGSLASISYFGAAAYYAVLHITIAPVQINHHPLFGAGIVIATLLNWLGGIGVYAPQLTGTVRICPSCGLRNIPERTRCKRCQAVLGPTEYIAENHLPT